MCGSAVLVHGMWSGPHDWRWVIDRMSPPDLAVVAPDLPSHRSHRAGVAADADEVAAVIAAAPPPVVAVGWSYGGDVIAHALERQVSVRRFVSVSSVPQPVPLGEKFAFREMRTDAHVRFSDDGTCVLDDEWWLEEEAGESFPDEVSEHLWEYRRRPVSAAVLVDPEVATAWQAVPVTLLLGRDDPLVSDEELAWARSHIADVRMLETDHFVLFREPGVIAQVIAEALA